MTTLEETPCQMCRGTGTTYLEHADGSLSEKPCPYCLGRKNSVWLAEKAQARRKRFMTRRALVRSPLALYVIYWMSNQHWHSLWLLAVCLFCLTGLIMWTFDKPKPPKPPRQPDPFTTDHEKLLGGLLVGGLVVKEAWDSRHPRQPQRAPGPSPRQSQPQAQAQPFMLPTGRPRPPQSRGPWDRMVADHRAHQDDRWNHRKNWFTGEGQQ